MKKKQWLRSLEGADDRYVIEAAPTGAASHKRSRKWARMLSIIAACLALALLLGTAALFIPYKTTPPSVAAYSGSEYFDIIQRLNEYNHEPPLFKNTFDLLLSIGSMFTNSKEQMDSTNGEAALDPGEAGGSYAEITDNQVAGVIEADLIKRSDSHIFYLCGEELYIYSIEGENSTLVGTYDTKQYGTDYFQAKEFFLSKDCKTLTVLANYGKKTFTEYRCMVKVIVLDVSNPASVKEISNTDVSGEYLSSRLTEHGLLLMTRFSCYEPDFSNEHTFVPQIEIDGELQSMPPEHIVYPETLTNPSYTVMLMMDATGQRVIDSTAFLSYADDVYVSPDAIYATREFDEYGAANLLGEQDYRTRSEIFRMGYGADGFDSLGSVTVDGYVLNQYSLDQYKNTLRVVTTTSQSSTMANEWGLMPSYIGANLYVIDLDSMEIAASVEQFAPAGEDVKSVRFDGDTAYVCTAIRMTDPVFFFDLSDLDDIKVKKTGTIEGFSSSLVNFANGYLLGIGRGSGWNTLKVEIYTEGEETVESFCKFELPDCEYSQDYKSYYIDREKGLIGLGIYAYDESYGCAYIVLQFDGQSIREVLRVPYTVRNNPEQMRGVYIDGYYYVCNHSLFDVLALDLD
ncbi:MAG: hypothetical protein E7581_07610 [Ruminococcaceae bacterium]|nr:hypothetical protein [Oscillospiraceae bacterium]